MRKKKVIPHHFRSFNSKIGRELIKLMKRDTIPSQWANLVIKLSMACHMLATKCDEAVARGDNKYLESTEPHDMGYFQRVWTAQIQKIDWYITATRKRIKFHGPTIRAVVAKAKSGRNPALFSLLETDPRWLCEKWVQQQISAKASKEDGEFFFLLGKAISNEKKKVFTVSTKGKNNALIRKLHKIKGPFPSLIHPRSLKATDIDKPKTIQALLDQLVGSDDINPDSHDFSVDAFKKLLKRHNLTSPIENYLLQ